MVGMFFFHLMMVAILAIKKMVGPPILVALLWAFDYAFRCATTQGHGAAGRAGRAGLAGTRGNATCLPPA